MNNLEKLIGSKASKSELVSISNTAKTYGSGSIEVYATPAMIGLMEGASMLVIDESMPLGFSSVGTKIEANHISATPIGMKVTAEAELTAVEGKKLTFKIIASDERGKIGESLHERFIVEVDKFLTKTNSK